LILSNDSDRSDEDWRKRRAVSEGKESEAAREMNHWWDKRIPKVIQSQGKRRKER
jgi:hypothetical protein